MSDIKHECELCGSNEETSFSDNLKMFMCQDCWDGYGEACSRAQA